MHNPIPISREGLLQSKDLHNTHPIRRDLFRKQAKTLNIAVETKKSPPQDVTNFSEPGGILSTSPSSAPSTPSCGSIEWEQLSVTGTDQSTISTEFEILKGYNRVPIYERRAQWLSEQQARREQKLQPSPSGTDYGGPGSFRPNSQLPFPITAQFLRSYGSNGKPWRSSQSGDSQRTVVAPVNHTHTPPTTSSYLSTPTSLPSSPESAPEISSFNQRSELIEKKLSRPSIPSRKTSGIPSFTSLFESRWDWDQSPKPRNDDNSPAITKEILASGFPGLVLRSKNQIKNVLLLDYCDKMRSRLGSIFRHRGRAFLASTIAGFILTIFFILTILFPSSTADSLPSLHNVSHNTASLYAGTPYVDFPALMSIESSFERIVEGATNRPNLARLLKQGEMSVSDLSTIIRHSNLGCKRALSEQLDRFVNGIKEGTISLQLFESSVREVSDQALGANEDFLGKFTSQLKRQRRFRYTSIPFMSGSVESSYTRGWLSKNFDRTTRSLSSNLETLISSGKHTIKSLESLSQQHDPIYEAIVREFVSIERRDETVWTKIGWEGPRAGTARRMRIRESRELLALVGGYEEKARGYVESIRLELESMMGGLEALQKRISGLLSFSIGIGENDTTEIPLGRQLEAVEQAVALMLHRRTQRAKRVCSMGAITDHRAKNDTRIYQGIFTPTRTSGT